MKKIIDPKTLEETQTEAPFYKHFGNFPQWEYADEEAKEGERLSNILKHMKLTHLIKSYKDFAIKIGENAVGLNDLKNGRKKLTTKHIKNMNISYPYINTDYVLFGEEHPFKKEYIIHKKTKDGYSLGLELDIEAIEASQKTNKSEKTMDSKKEEIAKRHEKLYAQLLKTKNELLEAKNQIISLQERLFSQKIQDKKEN